MPEILNKKQLEDAIKCDATCQNCSLIRIGEYKSDCIPAIAQTALAYRDMLERLEWSMPADRWGGDYCPMCGNSDLEGHTADCELAALLKESEGEEG